MGSRISGQPVIARFWRDPFTLLIACIAGLGTAHILVRTATYGAGISEDSVYLLSTALNFLAGEGWRDLTGEPLTLWPPLFPLLLAASSWVGVDPLATGRWVNATAFGLTILAAGCWLRSNLRSRWLALAATATIPATLPLSHWVAHLETDPLFVLLTLLALIQLAAFLNRRTTAPLWWAAIFTALAALTRWPGVALIGTGVLVLLPTARRKQTLIFGAVSSVPLLAVLTRNWAVTGDLTRATGNREPSGQPLFDGLGQAVDVFHAWIVPPNAPDGFAYLLGLAVAAVGLAGATVGLRYRQPDPEAAPASLRLEPIIPFGAFSVAYLVFMVAVVPFTVYQGIDSHYLLPIYVPLLLEAALLLDRFLSIASAGRMVAVRYGLVSLVFLATLAHVSFSAYENLRRTAQAWRAGYGDGTYNVAYWQQSETLNYMRDNHIEGRIYSSHRPLAWFVNRAAVPGKHRNIQRNKMRWIEAGAHIVWLDRFYTFYKQSYPDCDDLDLRVLPGVETVAELADGLVLRRTAYEPFDPDRHLARKQRYVNQLIQQASDRVVRAGWGVYRTGRKLIYLKEPCDPADIQAKFVLHVVPTAPADLPPDRQQYDSDNLDFYFDWYGKRFDDQCMVIAPLPDYAIDRIYIGQWISAENRTLWEAEFSGGRDTGRPNVR